jgi:hypothetical protein
MKTLFVGDSDNVLEVEVDTKDMNNVTLADLEGASSLQIKMKYNDDTVEILDATGYYSESQLNEKGYDIQPIIYYEYSAASPVPDIAGFVRAQAFVIDSSGNEIHGLVSNDLKIVEPIS